jgi:hypothetical protein
MNARKLVVVFLVFASAGTVAEASQAVDVVIYLTGADLGPSSEYRARTVLNGMFARIGIRISWFNGKRGCRIRTAGAAEDQRRKRHSSRIVVSATVGDRAKVLGKRRDLIGPVTAIAQRPMNKDHRHTRALITLL